MEATPKRSECVKCRTLRGVVGRTLGGVVDRALRGVYLVVAIIGGEGRGFNGLLAERVLEKVSRLGETAGEAELSFGGDAKGWDNPIN
jgi:hypothetical protein